MYFLRRLRPLEVAGERVRSLRVSLNAPVVTALDLPAGPARAVIVVHRESRGRMDATVGVRSVASGEIAYWSFDGELQSDADLSVAADAALTFAESLGFLFEEIPLHGAPADQAFRAWLAGNDGSLAIGAEPKAPLPRADALGDGSELELDELVVDGPAAAPAAPAVAHTERRPRTALEPLPAAELPRAPQKTLSKFRAREVAPVITPVAAPAAPAAPAAAPRKLALRQPLARVQLVKRRSPEDERKLVIRKLLTCF